MGLALAVDGPALVYYTQRIDGRPFVNCVPYTVTMAMRWMGYDPPRDFGMVIRKAARVPVREGLGTSYANIHKALEKLEPEAPVLYNGLTEAELLALLPPPPVLPATASESGWAVSVQCRMEKLPPGRKGLRRWVGLTFAGYHGICLAGAKIESAIQYVWWMDPMGKPQTGYAGEWAKWDDVKLTLRMTKAKYDNARGERGTAVVAGG